MRCAPRTEADDEPGERRGPEQGFTVAARELGWTALYDDHDIRRFGPRAKRLARGGESSDETSVRRERRSIQDVALADQPDHRHRRMIVTVDSNIEVGSIKGRVLEIGRDFLIFETSESRRRLELGENLTAAEAIGEPVTTSLR